MKIAKFWTPEVQWVNKGVNVSFSRRICEIWQGAGWSQQYDFTTSDVRTAFQMVEKMGKQPEVVVEMIQSIIYGSRMNNVFDEELLRVLVTKIMSRNELKKISEIYPPLPDPMRLKADAERFLQKLPSVRNAGALGLAKNAEKGLAEGVFKRSIGDLARVQNIRPTLLFG